MATLSVIIPAYNEAHTIREVIHRCLRQPLPHGLDREIIVVDDGSTDGTKEVLTSFRESAKVFIHEKNYGKGAAVRTGLAGAHGDIILIQDADFEYDPQEWPKLLQPIFNGEADVVYGSRFSSGAHRVLYFWHFVGNRLLTMWSNMWTNLNLTDMETGAKVFTRKAVQGVHFHSNRFGFEPEFTAKVAHRGLRVYEMGVSYHGRSYIEGKKITWRDGLAALWHVMRWNIATIFENRSAGITAMNNSEVRNSGSKEGGSWTRGWKQHWGIFFIGLVFAASSLYGLITVYGDGCGYYFLYQQMRDGNWSLMVPDEPPSIFPGYPFIAAKQGWSTYYQIGTPIFWLLSTPLTSLLHIPLVDQIAPFLGRPPFLINDAFIFLCINVLLALAIISVLIRYLIGFQISRVNAYSAVLLAFFGLPTWYYTFWGTSYSHIIQLALLTAAMMFFMRAHSRRSWRSLVASGALFGFAALTRIDALLFLIPFPVVTLVIFPQRIKAIISFLFPALSIFSVQIFLWWMMFGQLLPPSTYTFSEFSFPPPHAIDVLFSGVRGYFVWSPVALFGVIGLLLTFRDQKRRIWGFCGVSLLIIYALFYGAWRMWWGGGTMGQRFLIPLFPFITLGIAHFLESIRMYNVWIRRIICVFITGAALFSLLLSFLYPHMPRVGKYEEYTTPVTLLRNAHALYGFPHPSSLLKMIENTIQTDPIVLHLLILKGVK